jgi:hypothetical protein
MTLHMGNLCIAPAAALPPSVAGETSQNAAGPLWQNQGELQYISYCTTDLNF